MGINRASWQLIPGISLRPMVLIFKKIHLWKHFRVQNCILSDSFEIVYFGYGLFNGEISCDKMSKAQNTTFCENLSPKYNLEILNYNILNLQNRILLDSFEYIHRKSSLFKPFACSVATSSTIFYQSADRTILIRPLIAWFTD